MKRSELLIELKPEEGRDYEIVILCDLGEFGHHRWIKKVEWDYNNQKIYIHVSNDL